jgi:hypothetical protein
MSQRKPLAALAAVTAALALAVPTASASAATTAHGVSPQSIGLGGHLVAGPLTCQLLVGQLRFAELSGNILWANSVARVLQFSGCGGAAI